MSFFSCFSRRGTGSSTAWEAQSTPPQTQPTQTSKIQSSHDDRPNQAYAGEPQDMNIQEFTRTGSYYLTGTDREPAFKYLQASDVRRQVQQAPATHKSAGKYPSRYYNEPPQQLAARPPLTEYPIIPSPKNATRPSGNYWPGDPPGPVRVLYNNENRAVFDVAFHDKGRTRPGPPQTGRRHAKTPFSLATYHPAPTFTDASTLKG